MVFVSTAVSPAGDTKAAEIVVSDNGSWTWQGDAEAFRRFNLLQGNKDGLRVNSSEEGLVIDIASPQPFLLTFGPPLANIEITARVNLDAFKGRFTLVHHAVSAEVYDYFAIRDGRAASMDTDFDYPRLKKWPCDPRFHSMR